MAQLKERRVIGGIGTVGIGYPTKRDGSYAAKCEHCSEFYVAETQYECWRGLLRHAYECKAPAVRK